MVASTTIETRLEALEREVAELRQRLGASPPSPGWLGQIAGSQQADADFHEVLALGRRARAADHPSLPPRD